MIVSGTITSAPVGNPAVTTSGPVDENPPNGFGVVGQNGKWLATPGPNVAITALGTLGVGATATIDWTLAGYYTMTLAASSTNVLTFTNSAGVFTPSLGQVLRLRITGGGACADIPHGHLLLRRPERRPDDHGADHDRHHHVGLHRHLHERRQRPTFDVSYIVS